MFKKSGDKPRFVYQPPSVDDVRQRAERTGRSFDSIFKPGVDVFRPKQGENQIRFLPATDGPKHYATKIWVHGYIGVEESKSSYLCLNKMLGKSCPVCTAARKAREDGDEQEYKDLRARDRFVAYVLNRDADNPNLPLLYEYSKMLDQDIANQCWSQRTGKVLYIEDPNSGYDVIITKTGSGKTGTRYAVKVDREHTPIADDPQDYDDIIDYIQSNPINDALNYYDASHLEGVLSGTITRGDEDLDPPARVSRMDRDSVRSARQEAEYALEGPATPSRAKRVVEEAEAVPEEEENQDGPPWKEDAYKPTVEPVARPKREAVVNLPQEVGEEEEVVIRRPTRRG